MRTIYATYEFRGGKDPVIFIARTVAQLYAIEKEVTLSRACKEICGKAHISPRTVWGWFSGPTRTPKFETLAAFINAAGEKITVAGELCNGRYKPRVIKGRKAA